MCTPGHEEWGKKICRMLLHNKSSILLPHFEKSEQNVSPERHAHTHTHPPSLPPSPRPKNKVKPKTECDMRSCQAQLGSTAGGQSYVWNHRVTEWCVKCLSGTLSYMTAWWKECVWACVRKCVHVCMFSKVARNPPGRASPLSTSHPLVDFTDLPMLPYWVSHTMSKHRQEASHSSLTCLWKLHTNAAYNGSITKWQTEERTHRDSHKATRGHGLKKVWTNTFSNTHTHTLTWTL